MNVSLVNKGFEGTRILWIHITDWCESCTEPVVKEKGSMLIKVFDQQRFQSYKVTVDITDWSENCTEPVVNGY